MCSFSSIKLRKVLLKSISEDQGDRDVKKQEKAKDYDSKYTQAVQPFFISFLPSFIGQKSNNKY